MRALLVVVLGVLVLAMVGWITFSRDGTKASINLETNQIKQDSREMFDAGSKIVRDAKDSVAEPTKPEPENRPPSRLDDSAVNSTTPPSAAGPTSPRTAAATRTAVPTPPSNEQR